MEMAGTNPWLPPVTGQLGDGAERARIPVRPAPLRRPPRAPQARVPAVPSDAGRPRRLQEATVWPPGRPARRWAQALVLVSLL